MTNEERDSELEETIKESIGSQILIIQDAIEVAVRQTVASVISRAERAEEVAHWAQAVLTALNVGDVCSGSPLHLKLREVMTAYRNDENLP